jgi:glucan biosynthesis protein C
LNKRIYSLDALRAIMMLLGIVIHSAATYSTVNIFPWPVKDNSTSIFYDYIILFIHSFRIPVFFVLSGFFLALQYGKRGVKQTYINRIYRILLPFIASMVLIAPLTRILFMHYIQNIGWKGILDSVISLKIYIRLVTGHLWFLYYLFIIITVFHFIKILKIKAVKYILEQVRKILYKNSFKGFILFSFISFVCILLQQKGYFETRIDFVPDPLILLTYSVYFVFGYVIYKYKNSLSGIFVKWKLYLLLSSLSSILYFLLYITVYEKQHIIFNIIASFICSLLSWLMVFGLLGFFYKKLNTESKILAMISFSSYWIYVMHLAFVLFFSIFLLDYSIPGYLKFFLNMGTTWLILMILYKLLVEKTFIGRFLNGNKNKIISSSRE